MNPAYKANYSLIDWSDMKPRVRRGRTAPARSALPFPALVRSFPDPVQSMADGKFYDNPRELEATYRAANNPQGVDYICVGDEAEKTTEFVKPTVDRKARRDAIERAIEDVNNGNIPPVLTNAPV